MPAHRQADFLERLLHPRSRYVLSVAHGRHGLFRGDCDGFLLPAYSARLDAIAERDTLDSKGVADHIASQVVLER